MIMKQPTIAVLGALGRQGSSVVNSFLRDGAAGEGPSFKIRAVTSHVSSPEAKAFEQQGVDIVPGSTKNPPSLAKAFEGADTAFVVVNFWDPEIMTKEGELTCQIMDVAKEAGVKHVIYSTVANVEQGSSGTLDVPHFTLKAQAFEYLNTCGFETVTAVEPAAYYSNWLTLMKPTEESDGTLVWTWTGEGKAYSQYDAETGTGPAVLEAAKNPTKYKGKYILLEADTLTPEEVVSGICRKLGKKGRINYLDSEDYSKLYPGSREICDMVKWFDKYGYYGPETKDRKRESGKAVGGLISFEEWLESEEFKKLV